MFVRSWFAPAFRQRVRAERARRTVRLSAEPLEDRRTPSSVSMVQDIAPGVGGSDPFGTDVNGSLFFAANDGTSGSELWTSDGTAIGTTMVRDINPGAGSSSPYGINVNGTYLFFADDGVHGPELWRSDGTFAGTVMLKDIDLGPLGSFPDWLTDVNGTLFFTANDGTGTELWKSDGTAFGTVMVKDIGTGVGSNPVYLTNVNGTLFFSADDGTHGQELWISDGTPSGTKMVKDINPAGSSVPTRLTAVNGTLYFRGIDAINGDELWKSDGTPAGTVRVKDINPGPVGSGPDFLTNVNGTLFFNADDGTNGQELWKSDGTAAGTLMVKDINPGGVSSPNVLTAVNGMLFFRADDGINGTELWKSDGTATGTVMVKDINPGGSSGPIYSVNVNGTLYFQATDGPTGYELWKCDGTPSGTVLAMDINPVGSSNPFFLANVNGTMFFSADDGVHGQELWKVTDFSDDFDRVDDTNLGSAWTESPGDLAVFGNALVGFGSKGGTALVNGVTLGDVQVQAGVSVLTSGNSHADLLLRAQSPTAAYIGSLVGNNGIVTAVIRKGTKTLASAPVDAPLGDGILRFEAAGSQLRLFLDGTVVATAIDSSYKSGKVGVACTQFAGFDEFSASAVDPKMSFGDNFERNTDTTSLGTKWKEQAGDLVIVTNHVEARGAGTNLAIAPSAALKDVSVQAQVNVVAPAGSGATGSAGLVARYGGPADKNYYLGAIYGVNGVVTARIYRNLNGALTQLASAPVGSSSGLLRFEVLGTSLKLFINGVLAVKATDTKLAGPGQVGVRGTPRSTFDAFNAQQLFSTVFYDGFNRSAAADLGPAWNALQGGIGVNPTNQAQATAAGTSLAVRDGVSLKDVRLETTVSLPGIGVEEAGLLARVKDANNYYYAALERNSGGAYSVSIYTVVGNVKTRIGASVAVGSGTGTLRFEVVGNVLTLSFNGVSLVSVTDTKSTAAGLAGLRGSVNAMFDDFTVA